MDRHKPGFGPEFLLTSLAWASGWQVREWTLSGNCRTEVEFGSAPLPFDLRRHRQEPRDQTDSANSPFHSHPYHRRGRQIPRLRRGRESASDRWAHGLRGRPGVAQPFRCRDQFQVAASRRDSTEARGMRKYSSLRWKLTALIAGGSVVAAVIAAAGFSWVDLNRFWQSANLHVIAIAHIVADQAEPAITLGDRKAAGEILGSLRADSLL